MSRSATGANRRQRIHSRLVGISLVAAHSRRCSTFGQAAIVVPLVPYILSAQIRTRSGVFPLAAGRIRLLDPPATSTHSVRARVSKRTFRKVTIIALHLQCAPAGLLSKRERRVPRLAVSDRSDP
jgi:hypothetical protein